MKNLFFILPFAILMSGTDVSANSDPYVRGMLALRNNDRAQGYGFLEQAFSQETDLGRKRDLAFMLAFAPSQTIKRSAHIYAAFVLDNPQALKDSEHTSLLILAGDGSFKTGNIPQARKYYEELLNKKTLDSTQREYATYQLGWVYVNDQQKRRAVQLWSKSLNESPGGAMREWMLKDCVRIWAELGASRGNFPVPLKETELALATDALLMASKREGFQLPQILPGLRTQPLYSTWLMSLSLRDSLLEKQACKILDWASEIKSLPTSADVAWKQTFLKCVRSLEKSPSEKAILAKTRSQELVRMARWVWPEDNSQGLDDAEKEIRAWVMDLAGNRDEACKDWIALFREEAPQPLTLWRVVDRCEKVSGFEAFRRTVLGSDAVLVATKRAPKEWLGAIVKLAKLDSSLEESLQGKWNTDNVPEFLDLVLERDSKSGQTSQALTWIRLLARGELTGRAANWISQAVRTEISKNQNAPVQTADATNQARALLEEFRTPNDLFLWVAYALANPNEPIDRMSLVTRLRDQLRSQKAKGETQEFKGQRESLFALTQTLPTLELRMQALTESWDLLGTWLVESTEKRKWLEQNFFLKNTDKNAIFSQDGSSAFAKSQTFNWVQELKNIVQEESKTTLNLAPAPWIQQTAVYRDVAMVLALRKSEKDFELNWTAHAQSPVAVAKAADSAMKRLKVQIQKARAHVWFNPELAGSAWRSIGRSTEKLATSLEQVQLESAQDQQTLAELAGVVRGWK